MRTEHRNSHRALALLSITTDILVGLARRHCTNRWALSALSASPTDLGIHWVVLPGDAEIWPVRVLMLEMAGERHAAWFTYGVDDGEVVFIVQPTDYVNSEQAGETGRVRLQSKPGASAAAPAVSA